MAKKKKRKVSKRKHTTAQLRQRVGMPPVPTVDEVVASAQANLNAKVRAGAPTVVALPAVPTGVYFDDRRGTAIVYGSSKRVVQVVHISEGAIECGTFQVSAFTTRYVGRWPAYPLRRAARLYLQSQLAKSTDAERVLRALVVS